MIKEIIEKNQKRIEKDMQEIDKIKFIDFIDIFPTSEQHRKQLDEELSKISKLIDTTEKGNFYLLKEPIQTKWGKLKFLKIRFFDKSRLKYEAAPDFAVEDWEKLKEKTIKLIDIAIMVEETNRGSPYISLLFLFAQTFDNRLLFLTFL